MNPGRSVCVTNNKTRNYQRYPSTAHELGSNPIRARGVGGRKNREYWEMSVGDERCKSLHHERLHPSPVETQSCARKAGSSCQKVRQILQYRVRPTHSTFRTTSLFSVTLSTLLLLRLHPSACHRSTHEIMARTPSASSTAPEKVE
jgi:hypothetical protein